MNHKQINQLNQLANQQEALNKALDKFWTQVIEPAAQECKSPEDVRELMHKVNLACSNEHLQIRNMPGDYSVRFVFLMDVVRQKMKAASA